LPILATAPLLFKKETNEENSRVVLGCVYCGVLALMEARTKKK